GPRRHPRARAQEPGDPPGHARGRLPRPHRPGPARLTMQALFALTRANIRSYTRDRAALFWTLAFPLIFIFMFGFIFQGGGSAGLNLGWADEDGSTASGSLREAFDSLTGVQITPSDREASLASMKDGKVDAVIVVPAG